MLYFRQGIAPNLCLTQKDEFAFSQFLKIRKIASAFGINPREIDRIWLLDKKSQCLLTACPGCVCAAQIIHRGFGDFGRDRQLRGANKLWSNTSGRQNGLRGYDAALYQSLRRLAPIHFGKMTINLAA